MRLNTLGFKILNAAAAAAAWVAKHPQTGLMVYQGPSMLTGDPIFCVVTGWRGSDNHKTGHALQSWIMCDSDDSPTEMMQSGEDDSVCGDCTLRGEGCYVRLHQAPLSVWKKFRRGGYPMATARDLRRFANRTIRLGSYGDPAAVPLSIWKSITGSSEKHLGYTHAWRYCDLDYRQFCMASCESVRDADKAKKMGWNVFLVRATGTSVPAGYFSCPASKEEGHRLTCEGCGACNGGEYSPGRGQPTIVAHGAQAGSITAAIIGRSRRLQREKQAAFLTGGGTFVTIISTAKQIRDVVAPAPR